MRPVPVHSTGRSSVRSTSQLPDSGKGNGTIARMYCRRCQGERQPRGRGRGSPLTSLMLLVVFFPAAIAYEAWRRAGKYVCPACGKGGMIPAPVSVRVPQSGRGRPLPREVCAALRAQEEQGEVGEEGEQGGRSRSPTETPDAVTSRLPSRRGGGGVAAERREGPKATATATAKATAAATAARRPLAEGHCEDPPIDAVCLLSAPGAQATARDTPLVFSAARGNAITLGDVADGPEGANAAPIRVSLRARRGSVRLSRTPGLSFSLGNGRDNVVIHFSGPAKAVNAALEGMSFTPSCGFTGNASLWIGLIEGEESSGGQADVCIFVG